MVHFWVPRVRSGDAGDSAFSTGLPFAGCLMAGVALADFLGLLSLVFFFVPMNDMKRAMRLPWLVLLGFVLEVVLLFTDGEALGTAVLVVLESLLAPWAFVAAAVCCSLVVALEASDTCGLGDSFGSMGLIVSAPSICDSVLFASASKIGVADG